MEEFDLPQALSAQKEAFQMKMASLNARREELDKKELSLRGSLMKFNQFLIETDIKKLRAEKKANNERSEKDMRVQECAEMMAERGYSKFYTRCFKIGYNTC